MLETAVVAFTTYFAMVSPIEAAVLFAAMTPGQSAEARRATAIKGTLMADAEGALVKQAAVIGALLVVLGITYLLLLTASQVQRVMGITGLNVVNRVFGVLVTALAVQFIFDGIKESGVFTG